MSQETEKIVMWFSVMPKIFCVGCLLFAGTLYGEEQGKVQLTDAQGNVFAGNRVEFGFNKIRHGRETVLEWQTSDLLRIDFTDHKTEISKKLTILSLQNGDRIVVDSYELKDEQIHINWKMLSQKKRKFAVPLETIQRLQFSASGRNGNLSGLKLKNRRDQANDVVLLQNGDTLEGELEQLNESGLTLKNGKETTTIAHQKIKMLQMNPEWISFPNIPEQRWIIRTIDGSRLTVTNCRSISKKEIEVIPAFGGKLTLPLSAISTVDFLGGNAVYLSQLAVTDIRYQPFFSTTKRLSNELNLNRNIKGGLLQLRGKQYRFGLGMRSRSTVSWQLDQKYQTFRTVIGVDDSAAGKGDVRFIVQVDGKPIFTSEHLTGTSAPFSLPVLDVSKAKQMTLVVEFGERGDISDHADWCDTILVKKNKKK